MIRKKKIYKLKNSWKLTTKILLGLFCVLIVSSVIGFYISSNYIFKSVDMSYKNVIYTYNDKANYIYYKIERNETESVSKDWLNNIEVSYIDENQYSINNALNPEDTFKLMQRIEDRVLELNSENKLKNFHKSNLNMFNDRISLAIKEYNNYVNGYKNMQKSTNSYLFKYFGTNFEHKDLNNVKLTGFDY